MATQEVISTKGDLQDLITAGSLTLVFTAKDSTKRDARLVAGSSDDEVGTQFNGATYDPSVTFAPGTFQGKEVIAIYSDGSHEVLTMWPAVDNIANGSGITAAAIYLENGSDDGKSVDDASGKAINYFKYTLTFP